MNMFKMIIYLSIFGLNPSFAQNLKPNQNQKSDDFRPPHLTEGSACPTCKLENSKVNEMKKLKISSDEIESVAQTQVSENSEINAEKIARAKERVLTRIRNKKCPTASSPNPIESYELDDDLMSDSDLDESENPISKKIGFIKMQGYSMNILRQDPEAMEEIEDAIENKIEKCEIKAQKSNSKINQASTVIGRNFNATSSTNFNPYNSMNYGSSMMMPYNSMNYGSSMMMPYNSMNYGSSMMMPYNSMNYGNSMMMSGLNNSNLFSPFYINTSQSLFNPTYSTTQYPYTSLPGR